MMSKKYNKNKKPCLRCGEEFIRLDNHLKGKKLCKVKYLDKSPQDILINYDEYYEEFCIRVKNKLYKCKRCSKAYKYSSGLARHNRDCKKTVQTQSDMVEENIVEDDNIVGDENIQNIYNTVNINGDTNININNIILQDFENELMPDLYHIVNTFMKHKESKDTIKGDEIFNMIFKLLYIDTIENRGTLLVKSENDGRIQVRRDNDWYPEPRKLMRDPIIKNVKDKTTKIFDIASKNTHNKEIKRDIEMMRKKYDDYMILDCNESLLYAKTISDLIANKKSLIEAQKIVKKIGAKNVVDNERNKIINKKIQDYKIMMKKNKSIFLEDKVIETTSPIIEEIVEEVDNEEVDNEEVDDEEVEEEVEVKVYSINEWINRLKQFNTNDV